MSAACPSTICCSAEFGWSGGSLASVRCLLIRFSRSLLRSPELLAGLIAVSAGGVAEGAGSGPEVAAPAAVAVAAVAAPAAVVTAAVTVGVGPAGGRTAPMTKTHFPANSPTPINRYLALSSLARNGPSFIHASTCSSGVSALPTSSQTTESNPASLARSLTSLPSDWPCSGKSRLAMSRQCVWAV